MEKKVYIEPKLLVVEIKTQGFIANSPLRETRGAVDFSYKGDAESDGITTGNARGARFYGGYDRE